MDTTINVPYLIKKKRDGLELTQDDIKYFIKCIVKKRVQDTQIGAMLMAIFWRGMSVQETIHLTQAMIHSGDIINFKPSWEHIIVDKHSTGGVGDKISLILSPALAACGLKVPMVSGRGLSFTGGTLDKLESIPGYRIKLSEEDMIAVLDDAGCFIAGATASLAPADGILYQHRDITNTVDCLPLIVSSILSKKAAEGTKILVMDIKVGKGTFMKTVEEARKLVNLMMQVARGLDMKMNAVLSRMDVPIGQCVGNAIEVEESIEVLRGKVIKDVNDLVETLGGYLLCSAGKCTNLNDGKQQIKDVLEKGSALKHFMLMLIKQGVSREVAKNLCEGNYSDLPRAAEMTIIHSSQSGYITDIDALEIATVCWHLGAGRSNASDPIDHGVGIRLLKIVGDEISKMEPLLEVYHTKNALNETFKMKLQASIQISDLKPDILSRIIETI